MVAAQINSVKKKGCFKKGPEMDLKKIPNILSKKKVFQDALGCQFHQTYMINLSISKSKYVFN